MHIDNENLNWKININCIIYELVKSELGLKCNGTVIMSASSHFEMLMMQFPLGRKAPHSEQTV